MKFDYRGIVMKIKGTLEQIYKQTNCGGDFFVVMLVFDPRIETLNCAEYRSNDLIRLVATDRKYAVSASAMLEASRIKPADDSLSTKDLYRIFQAYCREFSSPLFSEVYPIYESGSFRLDFSDSSVQKLGYEPNDSFLRGVIAICSKEPVTVRDDFLVSMLPSFSCTYYETITREYLKHFASGIVNSVVSQSASLPANVVSAAGIRYMGFWGRSLSQTGGYGRYDDFVFNINKIAELAYESAEAYGRIIYCAREFPDEYTLIKFKNPYSLGNHKLVRKLLQIVDRGHCLGAADNVIYGIISDEQVQEYRACEEVMFAVNFVRERIWDISYIGNLTAEPVTIFTSEYESYKYVEEKLHYDKISQAFATFGSDAHLTDIYEIIGSAIAGRHGTMIVFSKEAESETTRLRNTCIPLKSPIDLGNGENSELVKFITSIDGAVFCDETGICYAIGVILDGHSSSDDESAEDVSRGARHNSAYRYIRGNKGKCVIVVISEDGDVSLIL